MKAWLLHGVNDICFEEARRPQSAEDEVLVEELVTHRLPLEELEQGLHVMRDKTEDYVKIMLT